jgi:hypothetical protein
MRSCSPIRGVGARFQTLTLELAQKVMAKHGVAFSGHHVRIRAWRGVLIARNDPAEQLEAHAENRWLKSEQLSAKLQQHDVLAARHSEAIKSGAIAAAFGGGLPAVAFDVGGIPERVSDGITGLTVWGHTASAFAGAIARRVESLDLLERLRRRAHGLRPMRSMQRFVDALWQVANDHDTLRTGTETGDRADRSEHARRKGVA